MLRGYGGGHQLLRKPEKLFLKNTTLLYALSSQLNHTTDIGTARELFVIQHLENTSLPIYHIKQGDVLVQDITLEIGGKNKKPPHSPADKYLIVKDEILIGGAKNEIPLWSMGFLY